MSTVSEGSAQRHWTPDAVQQRINELGEWFHNMELAGVCTAPKHFLGDYPAVKWKRFERAIPRDLRGKSVLDIGCNAGFYSIEMKRRGADRVLGLDSDDLYLNQARFAAEVSGVDIEFRRCSVYDIAGIGERFDLVLFMGVLYHLRHPLLALDLIHEYVTGPGSQMIFQSMQRGSSELPELETDYDFKQAGHFNEPGYPKLHFVEKRYCGDITNWWIPNRACAEAMLRSAGFAIESRPEEEVYMCRWEAIEMDEAIPRAVHPAVPPAQAGGSHG